MSIDRAGLYQEQLLDHYKNPRNRGTVDHANFSSGIENPSCGDVVEISGIIDGDTVTAIGFVGSGCVISQAAASMLTELALGRSIDALKKLDADTMRQLVGIELGPTRLRCAVLPLEALQKGIEGYAQ